MAGMHLIHRGIMNSLRDMSLVIPTLVNQIHPDPEAQIGDLMEYDFYSFLCHLATYDAEVSDEEIEFINSCYPVPQTRKDIVKATVENQWIGSKYLKKLPVCLPLFVEADNFLCDTGSVKAGSMTV